MSTIKDVAQTAGLSTAAVSKYLRDAQSVRNETRVRIEAAIKHHNYRPSRLARALRTGKTGFVSVAIPEIKNPLFSEMYDALMTCGVEHGLITILETLDHRANPNAHLLSNEIDGMVACFLENEAFLSLLKDLSGRIPVVTIDYDRVLPNGSAVVIDLACGMTELTEYLIRTGRRHFAYVGESNVITASMLKFNAFQQTLHRHGFSPDSYKVYKNYTGFEGGYAVTRSILEGELPDAIVLETDTLAVGCIKRLAQRGIRVPDQIAVTGFDDIPLSGMLEPALTTVRIPIEEICRESVALLVSMVNGNAPTQDIYLPTKLVVRDSGREASNAFSREE